MVVAQVVAHRTTDQEVLGSIPTGSWAFFSSLLFPISLNQWFILNQVPHGGATLLIFKISQVKNGGLAVQLEVKQAIKLNE